MDRLLFKLTSGQFILTVVGAFVFASMSLTGSLEPDVVGSILSSMFTFYFLRNRPQTNETTTPSA